jgi:thiamine biosynthesis protein ThiI
MRWAVIHYHEIALKGANRPAFVRKLRQNLWNSTRELKVVAIHGLSGGLAMELSDETPLDALAERLGGLFGVANYAFSEKIRLAQPEDLGRLEEAIRRTIAPLEFGSFRIHTKRADKQFRLNSVEINERIGGFVKAASGKRVDLERPDLTIHIDVVPRAAFFYFEKHPGPGGLPVGISGHVVALLSGGIDSPVASYLMMKRGCTVAFVHFHGHPHLSKASLEKAEELVRHLTRHQFRSRLYAVPFGEVQRRIVLTVPPPLRVVLYRRFMLRIAEETARREEAKALVTGESLGQVASQTLDNIATIQEAAALPILRPLVGSDKNEIIALARRIGTYPISILPDQDCCRLFIPPHPSVRAGLDEVRRAESKLDTDGLVKLGLEGMEVNEFHA